MGMHLGVYYKTKEGKLSKYPIQAESHDELGDSLKYAEIYIEKHITETKPDEGVIRGLRLSENEAKALKTNYAHASEYGTFEYYENEGIIELPEHFFTIYVDEKIAEARDPEKIPIPLINLKTKYVEKKDKLKAADLNKITDEIQAFLKGYYDEKGAWWYYAEVEVVKDFQHELIIEITDLKSEILRNERQYFEYIRITVKAEKQGKNIILTYDLMAKYGSGIFLAPRSTSDYKNIDIKYPRSLENYKEKIKSLILKHLTR